MSSEEDVWGAAASRPAEPHRAGLDTLGMEKVVSSLRVLNGKSVQLLAAENHEEVESALTRVLGWLHTQIAAPSLHTEASYRAVEEEKKAAELFAVRELSQVYLSWHERRQTMSSRLWMLWVELGCSLDVLRSCEASEEETQSFAVLVMSVPPPRGFPTSESHCNKDRQVVFSRELWEAAVAKPLHGAPAGVFDAAAMKLMEVYLHWMTAAMRGYEVAFIANVAAPLRDHLQASTGNSKLTDTWLKFANFKMSPNGFTKNPASVAVTVVVLSALASASRAPEVVEYLESLGAAVVDKLSRGLFPQPHSPVAIVAMALGLAALIDARSPKSLAIRMQSGATALLCQCALLRLLCLPLLSPRLKPCDDATLSDYQEEVRRRVQALVAEPSHAVLQEYSLRMTEACIEEMVGFFQTSLGAHLSLVTAAQSVLPAELFRSNVLTKARSTADRAAQDESLLMSEPELVAFLKQFYGGVAPTLEVLSTVHLVRSFLALSRIEFAREVCAAATANASMQTVTQSLEQALEQTTTPPEAIFAPVLRSLTMHSMTANTAIPPEVDIVAGCQALAVGLVMQRKLRIFLFQCTNLIDDALAVVFSGLYNVFEPVDVFAHRFLGVCLTHLGQFTPLFTVFPHYLQVTLAAYPAIATRQALTKACGAIFGSLFYSEALTMPAKSNSEIVETAQRMVLWAVRKCCDRSSELLAEENKRAIEAASTDSPNNKSGEKSAGKPAAESETDGLYLAGLVFELMKMAPMNILQASAMEAEKLLARWKSNPRILRELKSALFARISQNCDAEKRAWFAAWYIEVDRLYAVQPEPAAKTMTSSRL